MLRVLFLCRKIPCFVLDLVCLVPKYSVWRQKLRWQMIVDDQKILVTMDGVINYVRVYNTSGTPVEYSRNTFARHPRQATFSHVTLWLIYSRTVTLEGLCWMRTVLNLKFLERPLDRISIEILLIMCFFGEKYRYSILQCLTQANFTPLYNPLNSKQYCLSLWSMEIVRIILKIYYILYTKCTATSI
jgi:hypothetical protein